MQKTARRTAALSLAAVLLAGIAAMGCNSSHDSASDAQKQESVRLSEIADKTGGDWNKLTPDDKNYMISTIGKGDENVARTALQLNVPHAPAHGRPTRPGGAPAKS